MLTKANSRLADIIANQESIFVKRQPTSAALAARARAVLAGGVTSNWQITEPQLVWLSHGQGAKGCRGAKAATAWPPRPRSPANERARLADG